MTSSSIITIDVHGMTQYQAQIAISAQLRRASSAVYRIRVIHGYHSGTALRDMIRREYGNNSKVKRIEFGLNQGETDLVLREF